MAPPVKNQGDGAPPAHRSAIEMSSNKLVRNAHIQKRRRAQRAERNAGRKERQREREELGADAPPVQEPITIEAARVYDAETGQPMTSEEIKAISDEFSPVLNGDTKPRIVVTSNVDPTTVALDFIANFLQLCPNSIYFERLRTTINEFVAKATEQGYTDVVVIKEDHKKLSSLIHIHLPDGPTAIYKLSSFVDKKAVHNQGKITKHTPELILNNFTTHLGVRVGRMLAALFPHTPNFTGRQVITFHNQRDFIFFRFHRYVFSANKDKARLQELGPRFTLKLRALQKGIFKDPTQAEHEFQWKTKTDRNRRRFFL